MAKSPVLVIEDDEAIRESLLMILTDEGYPILSAENGKQGLELLGSLAAEHKPKLILLDLTMPIMSGQEFLIERKANPTIASIPVAVLTAAGGKEKPELATEFLRKPVQLEDLLAMVERYCG